MPEVTFFTEPELSGGVASFGAEGAGTAITDINGTVFNLDQVALDFKLTELAAWIVYELS